MVAKCLLILHALNPEISPPVQWQLPDSAHTQIAAHHHDKFPNEFWTTVIKPYLVTIHRGKAYEEYLQTIITEWSTQIEPYFIVHKRNVRNKLFFLTWPLLRKSLTEFFDTNTARDNEYDLRLRLRLLHQQGSSPIVSPVSDPVTQQLIAEANGKRVVDVGAGYGNLTKPLLAAGAKKVIAIDPVLEHLAVLALRIPLKSASNLIALHAQFPLPQKAPYQWRPNSVDSFAFFRVLQLMDGPTIERAFKQAYQALVPGGKIYVLGDSPFIGGPLAPFQEIYEKRLVDRKLKWPGIINNTRTIAPNNRDLPKFLHLLEDVILRNTLERAGFKVERSELVTIPPEEGRDDLRSNGRERVIASAVKPHE